MLLKARHLGWMSDSAWHPNNHIVDDISDYIPRTSYKLSYYMTPTIISVYANFCCLHVPLGPLSNQAPHHNIALSGAQHHFVVLFFVSRIDLDWQLGVVWNCLEYFFAMVAIRYPSIDGFAAVGCLFQPVLGYTSIFSQRLMEVRILKFSWPLTLLTLQEYGELQSHLSLCCTFFSSRFPHPIWPTGAMVKTMVKTMGMVINP